MKPHSLYEYHVFLASPKDMENQRQEVRRFFASFNRNIANRWNVIFTVVDWENYSTIGVGRPQELITKQTLEKFKDSLVLLIGLMGQKFGSPTGEHESGTEEEFEWALKSYKKTGYPEIKWFFRNVNKFESGSNDPELIREDLDQWIKVRAFRESLENSTPPIFYQTFSDSSNFSDKFREDLSRWLNEDGRPWYTTATVATEIAVDNDRLPTEYAQSVITDFQMLDIAGIDNDRVVEIPLSEVYVRLRVMRDEDAPTAQDQQDQGIEGEAIDIHEALGKYKNLVIVGDPGSGKSTFLKFIALMLSRAEIENDPGLASAKLNLQAPLPTPFFVSLWDLSDYLRETKRPTESVIVDFIIERWQERGITIERSVLEGSLREGYSCMLFDGLDEVTTERGRAAISRLVEGFLTKYPKNRYVVTSRVRGYTGDTILKGGFVRCDIQDFNEGDREEFLKNWFSALLRVERSRILDEGSQSLEAFDALRSAIEGKDRIRLLAVNPLLMTVIAIVHWNRKRLPDQRVDLYDECVDVLLGQRKLAERSARIKSPEVFDESAEEEVQYDRTWTRKRFAEIALRIQESGTDEITRDIVLRMLHQRFRDRAGVSDELAMLRAERFLDRQELRSGLLVSRRAHSCRFVHLTFQEYLAAWNLANLSMEAMKNCVVNRLRDPQWFETLQLLGGELAKVSDEKVDQYISWLLDNLGSAVRVQAPLIALCANILKDIQDVADVSPATHERYVSALRGTLEAFQPGSGVVAKTQLEVLTALIPLGGSVKEHLVEATKSAHYAVRSQAVSTLVSHLPDDDLFDMTHILRDRSQEPVFAYLKAILDRDKPRALLLLTTDIRFGEKTAKAILMWLSWPYSKSNVELMLPILKRAFEKMSENAAWDMSWYFNRRTELWEGLREHILKWTRTGPDALRLAAIRVWAYRYRERKEGARLLNEIAVSDPTPAIRLDVLRIFVVHYWNAETRKVVTKRAIEDENRTVRSQVLEWLNQKRMPSTGRLFYVTQYLLSEDFSWTHFIDPRVPIEYERITKVAQILAVPVAEVEKLARNLAMDLPISLAFKTPH
jgi:hypothetical protein